jgi:hypothetical protein
MNADGVDDELRVPAVVAGGRHRHFLPRRLPGLPMEQHHGQCIVAIREHVGADRDTFPGRPLDRMTPIVHCRADVLDDDPALHLWCEVRHRFRLRASGLWLQVHDNSALGAQRIADRQSRRPHSGSRSPHPGSRLQ